MLRKNQLKTFSIERLQQLAFTQTNSDLLILIKQIISQRNGLLNDKLCYTKQQLNKTRNNTKKVIHDMNRQVRDILNKKQKIIMDKNSRPQQQDIKNLTQLYQYMERQNQIIDRNNKDIQLVLKNKQKQFNQIDNKDNSHINVDINQNTDNLDKQYQQLVLQVNQQSSNLTQKQSQLSSLKCHLTIIASQIQQYRRQYQKVQSIIKQRQRQLDHLSTYYKNRVEQDNQNLQRQNKLTNLLENQLLNAQKIVNFNHGRNQELRIKEIQTINVKDKK